LIWYTNLGFPVLQIIKASTQEFGVQMNEQLKEMGFDVQEMKNTLVTRVNELVNPPARAHQEENIEMKTI
jgi:hypothetical protein